MSRRELTWSRPLAVSFSFADQADLIRVRIEKDAAVARTSSSANKSLTWRVTRSRTTTSPRARAAKSWATATKPLAPTAAATGAVTDVVRWERRLTAAGTSSEFFTGAARLTGAAERADALERVRGHQP